MQFIRRNIPKGEFSGQLSELVDYFDSTYVSSSFRRINRPAATANGVVGMLCLRRHQPLFPPVKWNVHVATLSGTDRTNNECESWNAAFNSLVGHPHPSLVLIQALQRNQALASHVLD